KPRAQLPQGGCSCASPQMCGSLDRRTHSESAGGPSQQPVPVLPSHGGTSGATRKAIAAASIGVASPSHGVGSITGSVVPPVGSVALPVGSVAVVVVVVVVPGSLLPPGSRSE